jgi:iron complex outermembrane receptor protein
MREFLAATATLALIAATPALAQTATAPQSPAPAPASSDASPQAGQIAVGDVVVTARKREESIRDIPGTISAVTSEQLNAKGPIVGTGDLLSTVPGVRFNNLTASNLSEISIRGSGTQRATGADAAVGLYVNGAYVGSSTLGGRNFKQLDYFDIERVEVLEGPQGGLYGRNSEFGVVNLVLAKPEFEDSGYVRNIYTGGLDQDRGAAVINQKLSDDIAIRVGVEAYGQTKGFYYDPNARKYYDTTNGYTARGQIRYRHGPLDVTLLVDGQDMRLPTFSNATTVPGGGVNPQIPLGYYSDRFIIPHSTNDGMQQKVQRAMLLGSYDLGFATLQSTTMYDHWHSSQQYSNSNIDLGVEAMFQSLGEIGAYPYAQVTTDVRERAFYQDLHLTGNTGHLAWIVGGEFLDQNDEYRVTSATSPCALTATSGICTGTPTQPTCIKAIPTATDCPAMFPLPFGTDSRTKQHIQSYAAYATLTYTLGDFSLDGEGRVTHDDKTAALIGYNLYTTTVNKPLTNFTFKGTQPTWTVTASYKLPNATHTLLYAKIGTGYRAGGVNNGTFNAAAPNPYQFSYGDETTISYEAGVKSNLTSNIYLRADGYISRTNNAIASITDGCTVSNACGTGQQTFNVNAGTIHAKGVEGAIDSRFNVGGGQLSISANAAWQHAIFAVIPTGVTGLPTLGSSVPQIPDWTMSASVNYRHALTDQVTMFGNVTYTGQRGGIQDAITLATPELTLSDFDMVSINIGLDVKKFEVTFFVNNLTNDVFQALKFQQGGFPLSARYSQPRTIGGSISYKW